MCCWAAGGSFAAFSRKTRGLPLIAFASFRKGRGPGIGAGGVELLPSAESAGRSGPGQSPGRFGQRPTAEGGACPGRSRFRPAGGSGASPLVCQLNADRLPPLPPAVSKKKQASLLIFIYCLKIPRITSVTNPTINRPVKICSKCSRTYPQTKMQSTAHMTAFINFFILRSPPKMNRNFHLFFFVDDEIKTGQNSVLFLFHHLIITIFVPTASMSTMNVCVSSYPKSGAKRL